MKNFTTCFILAIAGLLSLSACTQNKYADLDTTVADQLEASAIPGVFVTPVKGSIAVDTITQKLRCQTNCADIKKYFGYVIYPYTICTPPDFVVNTEMATMAAKTGQDSLVPILSDTTPITHQLTTKKFAGFQSLFCRTTGGPWGAFLIDEELCGGCGEGQHRFTLEIGGLPGAPSWVWYCTREDAPADAPSTQNMSLTNTTIRDCDPGDLTNCGGNPPVGGEGPVIQ